MSVPGTIDPRKVPRNAPCPCGSGKKFKKCCLRILEDIAPLARAQEEKARRAQFEAPPSISTMFKGKRVRALGSKVVFRDPSISQGTGSPDPIPIEICRSSLGAEGLSRGRPGSHSGQTKSS